jgi:uncharacterized repeat protein (TIGR01451 family)
MDSIVGRIDVVLPAGVDAVIDGNGEGVYGAPGTGLGGASIQVASAPASLNFTVEIQNEGGSSDQFTVNWNSLPGWTAVLEGGPSPYTTPLITSGGSHFVTFNVTVPAGALPAGYQYLLDIVSAADATASESITAGATVMSPPRADLVIDGNGLNLFGPAGSGQGGTSTRAAGAGLFYTAALQVRNAGSFPDSFHLAWQPPPGWPAASVMINDGLADRAAPFWTSVIPAGGQLDFTVLVQVPGSIAPGLYPAVIDAVSSLPPNSPESVKLITSTGAVLWGRVFNDVDHDAVFSPGDVGLGGVVVRDDLTGLEAVTSGDGSYAIVVAAGAASLIIEENPSGYVSLNPDSAGPFVLSAGDTVRNDFADVPAVRLTSGAVLSGLAGGYVDFPHVIEAGTAGPVTLIPQVEAGIQTLFYYDENQNGIFDGSDRLLEAADLNLDPGSGTIELYILLRVFVPLGIPAGRTIHAGIEAVQSISGTPLASMAGAENAVVVVAMADGRLTLQKTVDLPRALPGEVITYTIRLFNAGIDSVQNIVLCDPVSPFLDPVPDAFGPGRDVEWLPDGLAPVYLSFDPADADECELRPSENILRMLFSKNSPFYLQSGERGTLTYRARVK